ncbi:hypothetical protein BS50DRAFT_624045 [Corynespora cassiicola Philippines]|uniref:Uncharacterized protein n=1 Tax=Corynespora cassiicola Philippines TaxID=1448308 RepID=A0A2T2NCV9_CORCC|nr:hypothetical protein BS50DRAFT_624045 [Corynespora cassiicola Philippines]
MPRLRLTPQQNKDFRLFVRLCRKSLIAVEGYGNPILPDLLLRHSEAPTLLNLLLSLSSEMDTSETTSSPAKTYDLYDRALREIQTSILRCEEVNDPYALLAAIAGANILVVLSTDGSNHDWQHHAKHVIQIIDCADLNEIKSTPEGLFLSSLTAGFDIETFAIGRTTAPTYAWSRWEIDKALEPTTDGFQPYEISAGYPASLVSIIAELGKFAAANQTTLQFPGTVDPTLATEWARLNLALKSWEPPSLPNNMPQHQSFALRIARRNIQRAAMLYHGRRHGFHSNLVAPLLEEEKDLNNLVEDILVGVRQLINVYRAHGSTIANSMAWSLAVVGSECGSNKNKHLQREFLDMMEEMANLFYMTHLRYLGSICASIWQRQSEGLCGYVSLESVAREQDLCLLFM